MAQEYALLEKTKVIIDDTNKKNDILDILNKVTNDCPDFNKDIIEIECEKYNSCLECWMNELTEK